MAIENGFSVKTFFMIEMLLNAHKRTVVYSTMQNHSKDTQINNGAQVVWVRNKDVFLALCIIEI